MLIGGILLGLLLGLGAGGRLSNLASVHLRWGWLLFAAVVVRFGTEILLNLNVGVAETLRVPLLAGGFAMLLAGLWTNRNYPGLSLAFIGIMLNAVVIVLNGGRMPIWLPTLSAAGLTPADVTSPLHLVLGDPQALDFLTRGLIFGDLIPIPFPFVRNVASLGDVFLSMGLGFFLFASVVRTPREVEEADRARIDSRLAQVVGLSGLAGVARAPRTQAGVVGAETGLTSGLLETSALERPLMLGAQSAGITSPAPSLLPPGTSEREATGQGVLVPPLAIPRPSPELVARVRRHPYVRLALNGSFSALWAGQFVSLFGDRIHQLALAAAVLAITNSPFASAMVFVAAFVPNLLFSPVAGALVDRWDHKEVLVVSDLLRAATVLLIPIAVVANVVFVYPLVFLITSISIFFRPARVAILPSLVEEDELLTANSAMWVGETMADVIGYPLAGLFVVSLGTALPVAFWLDSATYVGSALLLSTIVLGARQASMETEASDADASGEGAPTEAAIDDGAGSGLLGEMQAGYRFLRSETVLFANTLQAAVAQLTVGILTALMPAYALAKFGGDPLGWQASYAFIETGIGVGNLVGGFVIGLIGMRFAKGRMIIGGYVVWGLLTFLFAISGELSLVIGLAFGYGIANMLVVIPSQTLFQERTPPGMMGRVVGFRFALVFGSMTIAMAVGGLLAEVVGVSAVIAGFGLVTMGAGLAGLLVPAVRDA